jgi:hypothetical protein
MAEYGSLRFVDKVGNNLLFRGGAPIANGTFDKELPAKLKNAYLPLPLPPQFYLVVICLLHPNADDSPSIEHELDYFRDNPFAGEAHLWDTLGTDRCYFTTAPDERERLVKSLEQWLGDPLIWRVATLRQWLESSQTPYKPKAVIDLPCVFYVHCSGGCDRTGEMIGAYRLRYNGRSWADMWGEQPCGRPMGCGNYRALQWYAFWLNENYGLKISDIGEDSGCYDGNSSKVLKLCSPLPGDAASAVAR